MDVGAMTVETVGTGSREQRRRAAAAEAVDEALDGARSGRPVVAVRRFGDGDVVVALGGPLGRSALRDVDAVLREVHHLATRQLVIDLAAVHGCHPGLAGVLGHARIRCLVDEVDVSVHNLPDELRDEYGHQIGRPATIPQPRPPAGG
jgi:hypothetical protein